MDRYEDYILTRLSQGCTNAAQIHREITDMGGSGGQTNVRAYVAHLRTSTADGQAPTLHKERTQAISPRSLRWLLALTRERKELDQEDQARLDQLLTLSEDVRTVHAVLHAFLDLVRKRTPERLRPWMEQANSSGIRELKSFVAGIERDYDAVKAALHLAWREACHGGQGQQIEDLQAHDVRQGGMRASCGSGFYTMLDVPDGILFERKGVNEF